MEVPDPNTYKINRGRYSFTSSKWRWETDEVWYCVFLSALEMGENMGYTAMGVPGDIKWANYENDYERCFRNFMKYIDGIIISNAGFNRREAMQLFFQRGDTRDYMYFHFTSPTMGSEKISKDKVETFVARRLLYENHFGVKFTRSYIIASADFMNVNIKEEAAPSSDPSIFLIMDNQLLANVKSRFSSLSIKLPRDQALEFYRTNNLDPSKMPVMAINDPVAVRNGWLPGDLIYIGRYNDFTPSAMCDRTTYYRVISPSIKIEIKKGK